MYQVDSKSGFLSGARIVASPNCDPRPGKETAELVVIHNISLPPGEFGGDEIEAFFSNRLDHEAHPFFEEIRDVRVSAHVLIRRDGEVVQFVPFQQRAWHAGVSCFDGRECCNDFSIGIELEGTDDLPYAAEQYQTLAQVILALESAYPEIVRERLTGHSDIAAGRKTDPGPAFDWDLLRNEISHASSWSPLQA